MHRRWGLQQQRGGPPSAAEAASATSRAPRLPHRPSRVPAPAGASRPRPLAGPPSALPLSALTSAGVLLGAWYLSQQAEALDEQDRLEASSRRPCPSCGGSGMEACMCTRWSDGDVGCQSCAQTGYMRCRSCGGSGTAVPIKVAVRKNL